MFFSDITGFLRRIPFWGWLVVFLTGAFCLFCAMIVAIVIMYPKWEQEEHRIKHSTTYPWSFQTINSSGDLINVVYVDGLGSRMPPDSLHGVGKGGRAGDNFHRVESLPTKITIRWRMPGDTDDRKQEFDFPQVAPGSDGRFVMELHSDQKWTMEFVPKQSTK